MSKRNKTRVQFLVVPLTEFVRTMSALMTGWHGEKWNFQNNEKTMEHSDHWILINGTINDFTAQFYAKAHFVIVF